MSLTESIERALISGDIDSMSAAQKIEYYKSVCESLGLNPLTQPLDYIKLNGKLRLYAKKDATDQLRRKYGVSVDEIKHDFKEAIGLYVVTALGSLGERKDTGTGAVSIKGLTGDALANAIMKAETKAKRRLTLSICGLGILDETELDTIRSDEPPPDDVEPAEFKPSVEENKELLEGLVDSKHLEPESVVAPVTTEDIKAWAKKLKVLGVERERILKYIEKKYGVTKSTDLTHEQLSAIVSDCMVAREKGLEALNEMLDKS